MAHPLTPGHDDAVSMGAETADTDALDSVFDDDRSSNRSQGRTPHPDDDDDDEPGRTPRTKNK